MSPAKTESPSTSTESVNSATIHSTEVIASQAEEMHKRRTIGVDEREENGSNDGNDNGADNGVEDDDDEEDEVEDVLRWKAWETPSGENKPPLLARSRQIGALLVPMCNGGDSSAADNCNHACMFAQGLSKSIFRFFGYE